MERRETEFKLLLSGADDVAALRAVLPIDAHSLLSARTQRNHFFDTAASAFSRASCTLRLRSEAGDWTLTAKGPATDPAGDPALSERTEQECVLSHDVAQAILRGERSPLAVLVESPAGSTAALVEHLSALAVDEPLLHLGWFENLRTRVGPVPLEVEGRDVELDLEFEFDRTSFPAGRVDWEVEVEVESDDAPAVGSALRAWFERAGLAWRPASTKAARFFASPRD